MKGLLMGGLCLTLASCTDRTPVQPSATGDTTAPAWSLMSQHFGAHLSGDEVVPPRVTRAQGEAEFQLSPDGTELSYRLMVSNITDVVAAYINLAPSGVNGPVVAFLFGPSAGGGRIDGVLATGIITAANLVGPLAGHPLSDLIGEMEDGNAYVDVGTTQFPAGQIRGQITHRGS